MTPDDLADVLVSAALGDSHSLRVIRDAAVDDPTLLDRLDTYRRTVAALDQRLESVPPSDVRTKVLDAARGRRAMYEPTPAAELFARQVEALGQLVAELHADDWDQPASPYEWTVHGLVAHLFVIEEYTSIQLGLSGGSASDEHHLAIGADRIAAELDESPAATASRWYRTARRTADALFDTTLKLPTEVTLHGWPFSLEGALTARAFEIWTHADDIRRATSRAVVAPVAGDLRTMSAFSVRALPLTWPLAVPDTPLDPARIVLTGSGGGTFDIGDGAASVTTVVTDVVDYCRMVARRISADELDCTIDGDRPFAEALLASASIFAV